MKLYKGRKFEIREGGTVIATGIVLNGFGEKVDDNELRIRAHADGLAIGMENHINLMKVEIVFIPIFLLCSILGFTTTTDNNYIGFILLLQPYYQRVVMQHQVKDYITPCQEFGDFSYSYRFLECERQIINYLEYDRNRQFFKKCI